MAKFTDRLLGYIATTAEEAFLEAMGLASRGGAYEPEMSKELSDYKKNHISKLEKFFMKVIK